MSRSVDSFLASFFGAGNDLSVDKLRSTHPDLADWLEDSISALRDDPGAAHVLPRRTGAVTKWYGLAHSDRQLRELTERLTAFVGPTYGRIDHRAVTGPDSIDGAVAQFTAGHALVLEVLAGKQEHVRRAIELLSNVSAQEPQRTLAMARPLGRLLREFDMAVLAGADATSADLLAEIERSGRLSAENLLFLRVRRLGGLQRFGELLALPQLATLLMMRRPARVTAALFDAVYTTHLVRFETNHDATGALAEFADAVLPKYPALFRSRQGLQTASAVKSYFLYGIVAHPSDVSARDDLLGAPDLTDDERRYLDQLDQHAIRPSCEPAILADAEAEVRRGNFDIAFPIARDAEFGLERAEVLLRCAVEMRTIEAVTASVSAIDELSEADRNTLTSSRWLSALWEDVRFQVAGPTGEPEESGNAVADASGGVPDESAALPGSWPEWFNRVVCDPHFHQAVAIAEQGSVEWAAAELTGSASAAIHVMLNSDLDPQVLRTIRSAIPSFLAFLERSGDLRRHQDLFDDVASLLFMAEGIGVADVQVLIGVIGALLETGISEAHYRRLITDFLVLWNDIDSPAQLDNGIELLDVLLTYSVPDPGARDKFFHSLAGSVARWRNRMKPAQWDVVIDLAHEMGATDTLSSLRTGTTAESSEGNSLSRELLKGMTVAIYTLTDQAALRAREFLNRHFDDVTIELSNDHVATDRLGNLAQTSDIFVVATRSAKHAATNFIQAQRPSRLPTVFAGGKGSTSLIRAVLANIA
jgi:hypothetical protein